MAVGDIYITKSGLAYVTNLSRLAEDCWVINVPDCYYPNIVTNLPLNLQTFLTYWLSQHGRFCLLAVLRLC